MKTPSPKTDQRRALREAKAEEAERRYRIPPPKTFPEVVAARLLIANPPIVEKRVPTPKPAKVKAPRPPKPKRAPKQPTRANKTSITVWLAADLVKRLKLYAIRRNETIEAVMARFVEGGISDG